jgi:uncharacterized repeat protein (TIGR01451 family)
VIRRLLTVALGVAALALGVVTFFDPGSLGASLPTTAILFVGLIPLALAYRVLVARYRRPRHRARTGDPERAAVSDAPGEDVSETVREFLASEYAPTRRGLRAIAVAVLDHYTAASESDAQEALANRTWTTDPDALAYFAGDGAPVPPILARLRDRLSPESAYHRRLRHATDAISAIAGVNPPPEPSLLEQWSARVRSIGAEPDDRAGGRVAVDEDGRPPEASEADLTSPWETGHLRGVSAVALVAGGVGALFREPPLVLVAVLGVGLAASARGSAIPDPSLEIERRLTNPDPEPDETITVTVTVRNRGERTLPDLRLVDGVPAGLPVVDGSPRRGTSLRPGERCEFAYEAAARRGVHEFDPLVAIARDGAGTREAVSHIECETTVTCRPRFASVRPLPLRGLTTARPGTLPTSSGGEGVEFHSVREYRRGDPLRRVDWNRRARTGEFATMEFREERATCVVCLIDARAVAYVTHRPDAPHAVDRSVEAVGAAAATLLQSGNRVGVATLGPTACWLAPATGRTHRARVREVLVTHEALGATPPEETIDFEERLVELRRRLPSDAQVLFFSPLVDQQASTAARLLDAYGYPVSVVSPDATATRTAPQRLARAVRRMRIDKLRRSRVPVVDWRSDESLPAALTRASRRWSR